MLPLTSPERSGKLWEWHKITVSKICKCMKQATRGQVGPSLAQNASYSTPSDRLGLDRVVEIRPRELIAWVEPNVTMQALVQETMTYGLIPAVVAPSKATTVAEAFATATFGSSSSRFGAFDCAVMSLDAVLPNGQHVIAKIGDGDDTDRLFERLGAPDSPALITVLGIALILAGGSVEMTYWPVSSVSGASLRMEPTGPNSLIRDRPAVHEHHDFVDSVMFDWSSGVIVTGQMIPASARTHSRFGESTTFVQHAQSIYTKLSKPLKTHDPYVETVSLKDYLFRYDDCLAASPGVVTEDWDRLVQELNEPTKPMERDVQCSHSNGFTWPISITQVESHSAFGRRTPGMKATLDHPMWHVAVLNSDERKSPSTPISLVALSVKLLKRYSS